MASLRSWVRGACKVCHLCSPYESHVYIALSCECRENLNQCNCNCATQTQLTTFHQQWTNHILANQNNTFAAQMNSDRLKRHLLLWFSGLSLFIVLILLAMILLIVLNSALLRRCAIWRFNSRLQRKLLLMRKYNLVEPTFSSRDQSAVGHVLPTVSANVAASVSEAQLSYADLEGQSEAQPRLVQQLERDLYAVVHVRLLNCPAIL